MKHKGIEFLDVWLNNFWENLGVPQQWSHYLTLTLLLLLAVVIVYVLQNVTRSVLNFVFKRITLNTRLSIFKYAVKNRLPHFLALIMPYSFIRTVIPVIFIDFPRLVHFFIQLTDIYIVFMVIWTLMSIIRSVADVIQEKDAFKNKPFMSYLQVIQIIFYILGAVAIFSIITGKSATTFFAAMGAASAVLMLMFKDTIMGFVSSIQLSGNDMLRIGDWITMSKYGADGTVEEINLTTVKVINFDKTVTTIPTYALISDSFQNWRGMSESGVRRFTRSLHINQSDITYLGNEDLESLKRIEGLKQYIEDKQNEYKANNNEKPADIYTLLNAGCLTNCDLFIEYATWYLKNNPKISNDNTLMVRTLAPTSEGLPIQLYAFTDTAVWAIYEGVISEVMNHLLASLKLFNLRIFTTTAADPVDVYIKETHNN